MKRQYVRSHKAWYANANKIFNPEIMIGCYHEDGSTTGEFCIKWYVLGSCIAPKIECFDDAWCTMINEFSNLMKRLGGLSGNVEESQVVKILDELGIEDATKIGK